MNPEISILCPSIRSVETLYDSITHSCRRHSFEFIVVGPNPLPAYLHNKSKIKYVKDFGSPVRCADIALALAEGELLISPSDDSCFHQGMLDEAIEVYRSMGDGLKNVLILKYTEGDPNYIQDDQYYRLKFAYPAAPLITDDNWWIFNFVIAKVAYFRDYLGGWSAEDYFTLGFAHSDMAIRSQRDGCVTRMFGKPLVHCTHIVGGEHTPIEYSHNFQDTPKYVSMYSDPANISRIKIDPNNWMRSPRVWKQRFGDLE